jgi:DNA-binding PadR family transcriptional regulator
MLVLRVLDPGPMHGLGVWDRIRQITNGVFSVKPGSLFPALQRLKDICPWDGWAYIGWCG